MNFTLFAEEVLLHTLKEFGIVLPFLFLTYLFMEFLEHHAQERMQKVICRAGKVGPLWGGLLGTVPQCGFSAVAAGLYAGRLITLGTLLAVFLSTSDEMLPIMLSEGAPTALILKILGIKLLIGIVSGFAVDLLVRLYRKKKGGVSEGHRVHDLCVQEGCHCEHGILRSALHHTLHIGLFLLSIIFLLNLLLFFIGHDTLHGAFAVIPPVFSHLLSALFGLIPNCASSVLLTKLYLEGMLSAGCMIAGSLAGSGIGLLMLFRANANKKEVFYILLLLFGIGAAGGLLIDLVGIL